MNDTSSATRRNRLLLDLLVLAALTGFTAWISLAIARTPSGVAAVWISNGIWAGWLLSRRTSLWPGYLAVGMASLLAARYLAGDGLPSTLALSTFNLVEVVIVAGAIRRSVPDVGNPRHWLGLGSIATASTLVACLASALLASAWMHARTDVGFLANFLTWYAAHVVGMVVVGTLALVAHRKGIALIDVPGRRWDFLGCMMLIAVVGGGVFYQPLYPLLFLVYPPLLFGVFRHRFPGVVVGISLLAVIGIVATAHGHGPMALVRDGSDLERTILLQLFIGTACLMSFPVALGMAERTRLMVRVRDSELRYRMLADYSHDVVVRMRADGQRLYVSPSARDILGWEPDELLQPRGNLVHPDDRAVQQQMIAAVLASGQPVTAIYRMRHKDGHYVWMEAAARPIPSAEGDAVDLIFAGRDVSERVAAERALQASRKELESHARMDPLTGLANRRQFEDRLTLALGRSRRQGQAVALLYMDVDHFKRVNDGFGHAAGDEVLRVFGQRLGACVRSGDLVARLGGDEFVVLVEDLAAPETAEAIARKLIAAMGEGIVVEGATLHVTTSIGIAYSLHPAVPKTLTAAADAALYAAKKAGRNSWQLLVTDDPVNPAPQRQRSLVPCPRGTSFGPQVRTCSDALRGVVFALERNLPSPWSPPMSSCARLVSSARMVAVAVASIVLSACATTAPTGSALVVGQEATIEGEVVSVDTNPWAYDGNAVVMVSTAGARMVSVQLPARWNLCKAQPLDDVQALEPRDRVQIVGTVTAPGELVVCAQPEHRLRKVE